MSRLEVRNAASEPTHSSAALMTRGSLSQFEHWLDYPAWFRDGTRLEPHPAPLPAFVTIEDDITMLDNIVANGFTSEIVEQFLRSSSILNAPGWAGMLALAPTAGEACAALIAELPLRNPYLQLKQTFSAQKASIDLMTSVQGPGRAIVTIVTLLVIMQQFRGRIAEAAAGNCVIELDRAPMPDVDTVLARAGVPVLWNSSRNRVVFPLDWLSMRNEGGEAALWAVAKQKLLGADKASDRLIQAVRFQIAEAFGQKDASRWRADVAMAVGLSERTLVRRLTDAGTSFTQLAEEERRAIALLLVADPDFSLLSISQRLGYTDAGQFGRAFRKWFGESPGRYRRRAGHNDQ